jgi:pSer/pThr/pTyr-binding forkhead associated (FHA) protein
MTQTTISHPTLLVKIKGQGSRIVELEHAAYTIGRKKDNDLAIEDPMVSGQHARIVKMQSVFFLEDLNSTNGTSVNGQSIDRCQLKDTDVIAIGSHRMIFQDNRAAKQEASTAAVDMDQTMVLRGPERQPEQPTVSAKILVTAGKTDRMEYQLTKHMNAIGSQEEATIRLTGWFAPKSAALIARRGQAFSISRPQGAKALRVNGKDVTGQQELKDGDQIDVAGVTLSFYLQKPGRS